MQKDIYKEAKKRVEAKKGFFGHLSAFVSVGLFFFVMNMVTDPFDLWFFFPMLPWGIGLLIHYLAVFGFPGTKALSREWEQKELEKEIDRLQALRNLENKAKGTRDFQSAEEEPEEKLDLEGLKKKSKQKQKQIRWDDKDLV